MAIIEIEPQVHGQLIYVRRVKIARAMSHPGCQNKLGTKADLGKLDVSELIVTGMTSGPFTR